MHAISCAHGECRCALSDTSPDPFCCEYCEDHERDGGRCECGHDACGGVPGLVKEPPARAHEELDPSLRRQA